MKLYKTKQGCLVEHQDRYSVSGSTWETLIERDGLDEFLRVAISVLPELNPESLPLANSVLAPIGDHQEVWAAGVTYRRNREARIGESQSAGGGDFYNRVYHAERPELFFKATSGRVVDPNAKVAIRTDAKWSVPEPELALVISPRAKILGYTVGNDMSARDIEAENPLYLPQAKVFLVRNPHRFDSNEIEPQRKAKSL